MKVGRSHLDQRFATAPRIDCLHLGLVSRVWLAYRYCVQRVVALLVPDDGNRHEASLRKDRDLLKRLTGRRELLALQLNLVPLAFLLVGDPGGVLL